MSVRVNGASSPTNLGGDGCHTVHRVSRLSGMADNYVTQSGIRDSNTQEDPARWCK
ncbi:hypothetical protein E2C01_095750 [Portunus trituberculatus]|uniref:Uncharacterized protein n=1 Tax=Portunus trituberculatus TaxID=210409 RepID=A0A5B7K516_PORTR|nr:hypothetical protein [Portunus trituberculatus]